MNQPHEAARTGLIGLGLMGRGIGLSLMRAGHRLGFVAHRRREVAEEFVAAGAVEFPTPEALARDCATVVCCLPSIESVERVLFDPDGIAAGARPGLLVVESSTLTPDAARRFAGLLRSRGIGFVDAPLTRGPAQALEGRLVALIGGAPDEAARASEVLAAFCERQFVFGPAGAGYSAKLINNFLAFSGMLAATEAMSTAAKSGLDMRTLLAAIRLSGGQSRILDGLTPWLIDGSAPGSRVTLEIAHKDIACYEQFAESLGTRGPVARETLRALSDGLEAGLGPAMTQEYVRMAARRYGATLPAAAAESGAGKPAAPGASTQRTRIPPPQPE